MKITADQLEARLKQRLDPIYLISGNETLLVEETAEQLRKFLKLRQFESSQRYHIEPHFDWEKIVFSLNHTSLLSERTLIEIQVASGKLLLDAQKALLQYLEKPAKEKVIILIMDKLETAALNSSWLKTINTLGTWVPIWPLNQSQLMAWIQKKLQFYQLKIASDAIPVFIDQIEGNLLAAKQEIEKLHLLYANNSLITKENLLNSLSDQSHFQLFDLSQVILTGEVQKTLKILSNLQNEGQEPTLILWTLAQTIRSLLTVKLAVEQGQSIEQALSTPSIRTPQKPFIRSALHRYSIKTLYSLLQQAAFIDRIIKGFEKGSLWISLQQFCISCCKI